MNRLRDTYKFCTVCTTELIQEDLRKVCPKCKKHYYFNPKPTVVALARNDRGQILLVKRAREPFKDWWDLPGGFVDEDESLEQALHREIKEETNLNVDNVKYVTSCATTYDYRGETYSLVVVFFTCNINDDSIIKVADDVNDYRFVNEKDIKIEQIAFKAQRKFLKEYLKT